MPPNVSFTFTVQVGSQIKWCILYIIVPRKLYVPCQLLYFYYIRGFRVFSRCKDVAKDRNISWTSSMDCMERWSHARGVYPTQHTSRMETTRVKEEEGSNTRIIGSMKYGTKERGHYKGGKSQTTPTSAKDLTIGLSEGRESPYNRLE